MCRRFNSAPDHSNLSPAQTSVYATFRRSAVRLISQGARGYIPSWSLFGSFRTMPLLTRSAPKYRRHKASGRAIVTLNGRDFYLGPHGTKASRREYDRRNAEWLANHRHLPITQSDGVTIVELAAAYLRYAKSYHQKDGQPTSTMSRVKAAIRFLKELYGHTPAGDVGPLALQAIQHRLVERGKQMPRATRSTRPSGSACPAALLRSSAPTRRRSRRRRSRQNRRWPQSHNWASPAGACAG